MTMTATARLEQQRSAIVRANQVRSRNMRTQRDIKALRPGDGRVAVADLLVGYRDGDPIGALSIRRLVLAIRAFGESKFQRLAMHAGIHTGDRKVRELSDRQRLAVADALREGADL